MKRIKLGSLYLIIIAYLIFSFFINNKYDAIYSQVINPLFWVITSIIIVIGENNVFNKFNSESKNYLKSVIIVMLIYLIFYCFLGLVIGFVRSPYSIKIIPFLKNIWQYIILIFGIEYVRSTLLNANKKNRIIIIFTTILFIASSVNFEYLFEVLADKEEAFKYIFGTIVPLVFSEILCSYLVLKGSYKLSFTYKGIKNLMLILLPIFPDLDWFGDGVLGILLPVVLYSVIKYDVLKKDKDVKRSKRKKDNPLTYVPLIIFVVLFAAFMMGLFKYEPVAILSNSMHPTYSRGDVLIICKPTENELKNLKKDNIIVYIVDSQLVAHRIIDVKEEYGEVVYQTKGDNNNGPDGKLVKQDQIKGIYKFSVKYIGYPSVYLNDFFDKKEAVVETK